MITFNWREANEVGKVWGWDGKTV